MSNSNLWPSMAEILNLGDDSPSEVLKKQVSFLAGIDMRLEGKVEAIGPTSGFEPLLSLSSQFGSFSSSAGCRKSNVVSPGYITPIYAAFRLYIGRVDRIFSSEILRIRYNLNMYYPVELWDSVNFKSHLLDNKDSFENCLREVFKSRACLRKLRYIILGTFTA